MISAETRYETHNQGLLAIVEVIKILRHYLEGCKYKVLVFTDHINLCRFIDTKFLCSRQPWWAQQLVWYHFRINYWQRKTNEATDALSHFPQWSTDGEAAMRAEASQIPHWLQTSSAKASLAGLSFFSLKATLTDSLFSSQQVLICETQVLLRLC